MEPRAPARAAFGHLLKDLRQRAARPVTPVAKLALTAGGMRKFMRQHAFKFIRSKDEH